MKKKMILMGVAAVLVLSAMIGGTLAGFNTQSEQGRTDIVVKALSIDLLGADVAFDSTEIASVMPGGAVDMPYNVKNDIEDSYDLYTRVTIYKYWENRELDASKIHLYMTDAGGEKIEITDSGIMGQTVNNWIVFYNDEEQVVLYYTQPLAEEAETLNVMDILAVDASVTNAYADQKVLLEIRADAVQKAVAEKAIPSEWGVYPIFDENGVLTMIEE